MALPFDGAISDFFENEAPATVREAIIDAGKDDVLSETYPYDETLGRKAYETEMETLQLELVKLQYPERYQQGLRHIRPDVLAQLL